MKSIDEILDSFHEGRSFNYNDVKKSMSKYFRLGRKELFPLIFKGKQWIIWEYLMSSEYTSTGKLAELTGIPSKNVSTQLSQMASTGLVKFTLNGKLKSWIKID